MSTYVSAPMAVGDRPGATENCKMGLFEGPRGDPHGHSSIASVGFSSTALLIRPPQVYPIQPARSAVYPRPTVVVFSSYRPCASSFALFLSAILIKQFQLPKEASTTGINPRKVEANLRRRDEKWAS